MKFIIYLVNIDEDSINEDKRYVKLVNDYLSKDKVEIIKMCAKVESELSELNNNDKTLFLKELGIEESSLDKLIKTTYSLLGLATYFTCGDKEVKAWTFRKGMTAKECAGII